MITKFEFGFVNDHEIALKEAGIPVNIISKISSAFSDCKNIEQITTKYKYNPNMINVLSEFEKKVFKKYI